MKTTISRTLFALAFLTCACHFGVAAGQVFVDDFDDANGTLLNGKAPDMGSGNWNVTVGSGGLDVQNGALDTTGGARQAFGTFTDSLSPGETLHFSFENETVGNFFSGGYANLALFEGNTERIAVGDSGSTNTWSLEHAGVGLVYTAPAAAPGSQTPKANGSLTYDYNTGEYNFSVTPDGAAALSDSGTIAGGDGYGINRIRIANNNGGDVSVAGMSASIRSSLTSNTVFADDFSDANGTQIGGKASDVGRGWTQTSGGGVSVQDGAINTSGGARVIWGEFSDTLSLNERLYFDFSTESLGNFFSGGYAGVSLYDDEGVERIFIGDTSGGTTWGLAQSGLNFLSDIDVGDATAELIYDFNTGDYSFLLDGEMLDSGTITAGLELDSFRVANNNGGDIKLTEINARFKVPEPTTFALAALGLLGVAFGMIRRKK